MATPYNQSAHPAYDGTQATYTWPAIPIGSAANLTVAVPSSTSTVWTVQLNGTTIGTTMGPSPYGPVYVGQGQQITMVGTPPGGFTGSAVALGTIGTPTEIVPAAPTAGPSIIGATITAGTVDATITGPVAISGGTIDIGNTPAVTVTSGTVDIGTGTVTVGSGNIAISNSPTVQIAAGQNIGISSGTVDIGNTPTVNISAGQVVQVTNEPSGSLTVAGTVDATVNGNVDINAGTVDVQPVEAVKLATQSGSGTAVVTPNAKAVALHIVAATGAIVSVQGANTLAVYPLTGTPSEYADATVLACTIDTSLDSTYNVSVTVGALTFGSWYVAEVYAGATTVVNPVSDGGPTYAQAIQATAGANFVFNITPAVTSVRILSSGGPTNPPTVATDNSGTLIPPYYPVRLLGINSDGSTWWEALVSQTWDLVMHVQFGTSVTASIWTSTRVSDWPTSKTTFTVNLPNPAAGSDWAYTLPIAAKVRAVWAQLATSSTTASRWPTLVEESPSSYAGYSYMTDTAIPASTSAHLQGRPGAGAPYSVAGPATITYWTFPDLALPAGGTVQSVTFNLDSADQWSDVQLMLEPA